MLINFLFIFSGAVNSLLSWRAFIPLSRLTYSAYLIHPIVIQVFYSSFETPLHFSDIVVVSIAFHVMYPYSNALLPIQPLPRQYVIPQKFNSDLPTTLCKLRLTERTNLSPMFLPSRSFWGVINSQDMSLVGHAASFFSELMISSTSLAAALNVLALSLIINFGVPFLAKNLRIAIKNVLTCKSATNSKCTASMVKRVNK